jgi:pyruvate/2-oxoglutarate dehydrogenase complex dihydrolipoamide acyltransferase (E2) component
MKEPSIGKATSIPLTRIQKLIGKRMAESKRSKPCFYIQSRADVTELMSLRPKLSKSLGAKITSNSFLIRSLALAAKKYPLVIGTVADRGKGNSSAAGERVTRVTIAETINVGFAVNAPQGLVVPVIKEADKKSLVEIARLEKTLTEKARSQQIDARGYGGRDHSIEQSRGIRHRFLHWDCTTSGQYDFGRGQRSANSRSQGRQAGSAKNDIYDVSGRPSSDRRGLRRTVSWLCNRTIGEPARIGLTIEPVDLRSGRGV